MGGYDWWMDDADLQTIAQTGVAALRAGDAATARRAFEQVVAAGRATTALWLMLARACDATGDAMAAHAALDRLLGGDPGNLHAFIAKGDLLGRAGDDRAAVSWYQMALGRAERLGTVPPDLAEPLRRAAAARDAAAERFQAHLRAQLAAEDDLPSRFAEALDIMSGRAVPQLQQPSSFFYPGLPQIAFYEPSAFDWLPALAAEVPAMIREVEAVLADSRGVTPYVEVPEDNRPSRGHSLLGDPKWSAFHLWQNGEPVADNAARCPATMAALAGLPIPRIAGRSPMVLFSILRAGTHIPPHHGMINTRLICHIPLVVPPDCRLQVGNSTRTVEQGKALIFDDSIEHEAWNDSDQDRAILLFEIWRPELSEAERTALTTMFEAIGTYPGSDS